MHYAVALILAFFLVARLVLQYARHLKEKETLEEATDRAWAEARKEAARLKKRFPDGTSIFAEGSFEARVAVYEAYKKWVTLYRSNPANTPPAERAMREYMYGRGDSSDALQELLNLGLAERSSGGGISLNQKGRDYMHGLYMDDR